MEDPISDEMHQIREAIYAGHKIQAIKLYRESRGADLLSSKEFIEKLEADLRAKSPERFHARHASGGCFGAMILALFLAIASSVAVLCRGGG